ncbi:dTDP-4-amino-4,6-dideoxygalactose transaminase [Legionella waltersii]|uniref:Aminotransferase WecE n=1 Tax=Legionella waltersii TaxID=66969 RepID=A0A0W1ANB8_9GAMM|nr:dTDP-4-amino-4,6-dideoxygalactose transaminase [Legionella waltersii]KTD82754.1 aminotransferase WecE [Legionella waltersii]SNV01112.1 aminotransferase [Legionella waltersii]
MNSVSRDQQIVFNSPPYTGNELEYIKLAIQNKKLCGDNYYSKLCESWFVDQFKCNKIMLTPSCTSALELAALLIKIEPGDEVIMPSYTFVSTANAFVLRGAKIKFVDINPTSMNIEPVLIEPAITVKTKAIVVVHYAGVSCDMELIMSIANKHNLFVIEDAAQAVMSKYNNQPLGTIGHLGCYSFHETKNYTSGGEGGALLINDPQFNSRADILREKGTDRSLFLKGQIDKYSWRDIGSSFLPSELQSAFLYAQLLYAEDINKQRNKIWNMYYTSLRSAVAEYGIETSEIQPGCDQNAHMFFLKFADIDERSDYIRFMKKFNIQTSFHYVPLHSSPAGLKFGEFHGVDNYTSKESQRLVRIPLWYNLPEEDALYVIEKTLSYIESRG